jgi:hypothetical protein
VVPSPIPEVVAMKISGHKTRYNIVSESSLNDAARKIEEGKRDCAEVGRKLYTRDAMAAKMRKHCTH